MCIFNYPSCLANFLNLHIGAPNQPDQDASKEPDKERQQQDAPMPADMPDILTAPGSCIFKVDRYHNKLMNYLKKLSEVAQVTVRMETEWSSI